MNETAFFRADAEAALQRAWATRGKEITSVGSVAAETAGGCCLLPLVPVLSKMQFFDAEELLVDEEDDVFGEGKRIFLAGASLACFALF